MRCHLGGIALILPSVLLVAPASISVCCCVLSRANKTRPPPAPTISILCRFPPPSRASYEPPPPIHPPSQPPPLHGRLLKKGVPLRDDTGKCRHHSHRHRLHMFCFCFCRSLLFVSTFQKSVCTNAGSLPPTLLPPLPLPLHKPP